MNRIGDFVLDHLGKIIVVALGVCIVMLFVASRAIGQKCDTLLRLADSRRDSADAIVACEKMHADFGRNVAIGAAAGAIAGSASRR